MTGWIGKGREGEQQAAAAVRGSHTRTTSSDHTAASSHWRRNAGHAGRGRRCWGVRAGQWAGWAKLGASCVDLMLGRRGREHLRGLWVKGAGLEEAGRLGGGERDGGRGGGNASHQKGQKRGSSCCCTRRAVGARSTASTIYSTRVRVRCHGASRCREGVEAGCVLTAVQEYLYVLIYIYIYIHTYAHKNCTYLHTTESRRDGQTAALDKQPEINPSVYSSSVIYAWGMSAEGPITRDRGTGGPSTGAARWSPRHDQVRSFPLHPPSPPPPPQSITSIRIHQFPSPSLSNFLIRGLAPLIPVALFRPSLLVHLPQPYSHIIPRFSPPPRHHSS